MSLRRSELDAVIGELSTKLVGAFVQKAYAPLPKLCFLELRLPGHTARLCLSAESGVARVSIAAERFPSPQEPPPFQRWLRQELIGAKLIKAEVPATLIASLVFEREGVKRQLVVELRGTGANIVLLDEADRVLASSVMEPERTRPGRQWVFDAAPETGAPDESRLVAKDGAVFPLAEAAEALYGAREHERRAAEIRRKLQGPLKARRVRVDRTIAKVEAEANRSEEAERHRELGELLAQNLYRIKRGQTSVKLTRYTEAGVEELEVKLDPRRSPKEEADWHFHQYRRILSGMEHAKRRLAELEQERADLDERLRAIAEREDEALLQQVDVLVAPKKKGPEKGRPYKEFVAVNGARILVGRSADSNDELTFRIARPFDIWLHARGVPGSHVVLEGTKNVEPQSEALIDAAHLAHHYSQNKSEPRGEVAYTQVKFVQKVKGGAPGQVTFTRDKSIALRVEPARLERLLKSQSVEPA